MRGGDGVEINGLDVVEKLSGMESTDNITCEETSERVSSDRESRNFLGA